jgi:hypothetical protein
MDDKNGAAMRNARHKITHRAHGWHNDSGKQSFFDRLPPLVPIVPLVARELCVKPTYLLLRNVSMNLFPELTARRTCSIDQTRAIDIEIIINTNEILIGSPVREPLRSIPDERQSPRIDAYSRRLSHRSTDQVFPERVASCPVP